jgi:hypothetical protein
MAQRRVLRRINRHRTDHCIRPRSLLRHFAAGAGVVSPFGLGWGYGARLEYSAAVADNSCEYGNRI